MSGMRYVVETGFVPHNVPKEGRVPLLYADLLGLITTGIGDLVDASPQENPWRPALPLPWLRPDGTRATAAEIREAWQAVKRYCCGDYSNPRHCAWEPKKKCAAHGGWRVAETLTSLRLSEQAIGELVSAKLWEMWRHLCGWIPGLEEWNANGQLGALNMAWALGPAPLFGGAYPTWTKHARARDFLGMAAECKIREDNNPGVAPRNASNRILFTNAHYVDERKLDPDVLFYPASLKDAPLVSAARTPVAGEDFDRTLWHGDPMTDDELRGFALATLPARRAMTTDAVFGIGPTTTDEA